MITLLPQVEAWLSDLTEQMKLTLQDLIIQCVNDHRKGLYHKILSSSELCSNNYYMISTNHTNKLSGQLKTLTMKNTIIGYSRWTVTL